MFFKATLTLRLFFSVWYAESSSFQFSSNDRRFDRTAWFFSITAFGSLVVGSFANNCYNIAHVGQIRSPYRSHRSKHSVQITLIVFTDLRHLVLIDHRLRLRVSLVASSFANNCHHHHISQTFQRHNITLHTSGRSDNSGLSSAAPSPTTDIANRYHGHASATPLRRCGKSDHWTDHTDHIHGFTLLYQVPKGHFQDNNPRQYRDTRITLTSQVSPRSLMIADLTALNRSSSLDFLFFFRRARSSSDPPTADCRKKKRPPPPKKKTPKLNLISTKVFWKQPTCLYLELV